MSEPSWSRAPSPGGALALSILAVAAVLAVASRLLGAVPDTDAPDPVGSCAEIEAAARAAAASLPARVAEAQRLYRERDEVVGVFAPTPCAPGWRDAPRFP